LVFSKTNIKSEFLNGLLVGSVLIMCDDVNLYELHLTYLNGKNADNLR